MQQRISHEAMKCDWLAQANLKIRAVVNDCKNDEELVSFPGEEAIIRAVELLRTTYERFNSLNLPGVTVDDSVIDLSWAGQNEKLEMLVSDNSYCIAHWNGKASSSVTQAEALQILTKLHRKPAHA